MIYVQTLFTRLEGVDSKNNADGAVATTSYAGRAKNLSNANGWLGLEWGASLAYFDYGGSSPLHDCCTYDRE